MMRFFLILILMMWCSSLFAQDTVIVIVTVKSKKEQETIQNVEAVLEVDNQEAFRKRTNTKGVFSFKALPGSGITYKLSHTQFNPMTYTRRVPSKYREDTITYEFVMESVRIQNLQEYIVYPHGVPQVVYKSKRLHVADFEVQNDGDLLLLTYPKRLKKGSQLLLYDGMNVKSSFQVPGTAEELIRDYRGNPHVVCEKNIYGIHTTKGAVGISTVSRDYYMTYLAPILDTNKTKLYFSNFNPDYPAFDYFSFDRLDSTYKKIMEIEDELMMELYRSEYKWVDVRTKLWAKNKELETGIDAEIWVGANYFTQSIYYKELYAPLFHRNDSLFVFDYYKDKLYTYDAVGKPLDSVGIYHHYNPKANGWKKQLIQDRATGQVYALFDRAGYTYIGWVDTKTGEISEQVKLQHRYVDKVEIHGNFVYYIYREFESIDKRHLYKERLPYNFGIAYVPDGDDEVLNEE